MRAPHGLALLLTLTVNLAGCSDLGDGTGGPGPSPEVSYQDDVRPVLASTCVVCHGSGGGNGGLDLSTHAGLLAGGAGGPAVIPGRPDSSLLVDRLETDNAALRMPPGGSLSAAQIAAIREWIAGGALDN
jgi:mono/diheme cytochrome c family protein